MRNLLVAAAIWVALYVIRLVWGDLPPRIEQIVWAIFGLLVIIYILMAFSGGAPMPRPFHFG